MRTITRLTTLVACSLFLLTSGCASWYRPASTQAGSVIIAQATDKAIHSGVNAAAGYIDTGNPYLHSLADALRANSGSIVNPADVQRIAVNYGDPANQHKFKQLGADLWVLLKNATAQYGKVAGTELVAQGLNQAGMTPAK